MRVPLEWLKEFVPIRLAPETLAERLTMAGLEVTGVATAEGGPVFELEVTPNRADCLSIVGVAREVAALTGQRLKVPRQKTKDRRQVQHPKTRLLSPVSCLKIAIEDRQGCGRYIGRLLEGVRVGPSPAWMQRRLAACGIRPISNVVDITNYVLLELGQPLHAFDFARLADGTIRVRRAKAGERLLMLDGQTWPLSPETLVIADARQPVAVAGVMGGAASAVQPETASVLLESALFDPLTVRRTGRRLGVATESSYRFERGVDPMGVEAASARASALLQELAGAREAARVEAGRAPAARTAIALSIDRLDRWLGTRTDPAAARTMLARLSCRVASSGSGLRVIPPSFRHDLTQEVDLYEEVARLAGYDRIPARLLAAPLSTPVGDGGDFGRLQSLRCLCASLGLFEAVSWSLVSEADLARAGVPAAQAARLANPLSQDHAYVRPTLLIGLLSAARRNLAQGAGSVRLFEVGGVIPAGERRERQNAGLLVAGHWSRDWHGAEPSGFFRLKGLIEALIRRWCEAAPAFEPSTPAWAEPGHAADVQLQGRPAGVAGQVSARALQALDIEQPIWFAELSIPELLAMKRRPQRVTVPPVVPPVKRDLSFTVASATPFAEIAAVIREAGGGLAVRVELIDRYTGPQIPRDKASLTFSLEYRDPSRTLTAAEVDAVHRRIAEALAARVGAALR